MIVPTFPNIALESGVNWQKKIEKDILEHANTAIAMKRWIGNVISFMVEHGIAQEGEKYRYS